VNRLPTSTRARTAAITLNPFLIAVLLRRAGTIPIVGAQFVILLFREFVGIVKKCEAGTFRRRMQDKQRYGWIDNYELGSCPSIQFGSKKYSGNMALTFFK
jgi:hypothetical protein